MAQLKRQLKVAVVSFAEEFIQLDVERQRLEKEARDIRKKLDELKSSIQDIIGAAEQCEMPYVQRVGDYYITQILKHRDVEAYSYDFIDFKVLKG